MLSIETNLNVVLIIGALIAIIIYLIITDHRKKDDLEKRNVTREKTVAFVTHEMRTSLTSTGWALQVILQNYGSKLLPVDRKMIEDLVESIRVTVMHSVNLLDMSLIDIGKLAIHLELVTLDFINKNLVEIIQKYSYGAKEKSINFTTDVQLDYSREMYADIMRLRIVIENLLENAIQYVKREKKDIHLSVKNTETDLSIVVSDTGIGIPKSEQDKIFSEFYRATNAQRESSHGSGIGLFMCKEYINAHNGNIRFESRENEGTTFFITIPLKARV
jgi:signal transduction histidine kinase